MGLGTLLHALTLPERVEKFWIPGGDAGVHATLGHMRRLVRQGMVDPMVRAQAQRITGALAGRDGEAQARAIRAWLSQQIVFLRDPSGVELLHSASRMLTMAAQQGNIHVDCDDAAILAAALGASVGLRARFVVVGFGSPSAPYRHVWTELSNPSGTPRWIEQDVTRTAQNLPRLRMISRRLIVGAA